MEKDKEREIESGRKSKIERDDKIERAKVKEKVDLKTRDLLKLYLSFLFQTVRNLKKFSQISTARSEID